MKAAPSGASAEHGARGGLPYSGRLAFFSLAMRAAACLQTRQYPSACTLKQVADLTINPSTDICSMPITVTRGTVVKEMHTTIVISA